MVFCGMSRSRASSPAGTPSGSCLTRSRNVSILVDCARAASAIIAESFSIYRQCWICGFLSTPLNYDLLKCFRLIFSPKSLLEVDIIKYVL
ncbi:hypothetical protein AGR13a_Cc210175 [Agrobacterium genomosp. 13 str. CFBP 6927]|uniref:Uncharacterized protein n=1 Tax=Agrobacterium genomosp. 13 str. CFBP 6927 TaxID=1183428 RepID=A0ABM9VDF0_9HYPH|nr:hypothetical protein AGR13a_Cc210175 [Agrobacterium genomosp. 13 str. CFBP 6927]